VERLREEIQRIADQLLDTVIERGHLDVLADLASPLPAIVTARLLGVPTEDHRQLKQWSAAFAEVLGNFQHNPDHAADMLKSAAAMSEYFRLAVREQQHRPRQGLVRALLEAEVDGDRFTEDEVIANCIITMVGGQETTTNLIGNGIASLLHHPTELDRLRRDPGLLGSAVEELLRYESPSQHTARLAHEDFVLGGQCIRRRQAVIAVMGAANRDPARFPDPDRLDLARPDNRHLAFGWAAHFCFGAPLARLEGQIVLATLLRRLTDLRIESPRLQWRTNLGLRGLTELPVSFSRA